MSKSVAHDNLEQKHNDPVMKRMWTYMETARPAVFTSSNKEGIERVLRGDYAYLMEALSIEYLVERNCNLTQIGGLLDNKGYGIATPLSTYAYVELLSFKQCSR